MSLKQLIKRQKLLDKAINYAYEMDGEPLIYSVKFRVGKRTRGLQFFRNMQWRSMLKCTYRSFFNTKIPVVLLVRFYVSPPCTESIPASVLRAESMPATMSYELCDYTLSFIEMLHHVLINSYKQIVKLDVEKIYSNNPRTIMQFMKWEEYDKLYRNNPDYSKGEGISANEQRKTLQSKRQRNVPSKKVHAGEVLKAAHAATEGTASCDSTLRVPLAERSAIPKAKKARLNTACKAP